MSTASPTGASPLPDTDWALTRPFWQAASRGELVIPRCEACARFVWYPAEVCPGCSGGLVWTPVTGRGTLFSWAVVERALYKPLRDEVPYVTGLVALEEDPSVRLVTRLADCSPDALRIDMPMRVVFRPLRFPGVEETVMAPWFTPAA